MSRGRVTFIRSHVTHSEAHNMPGISMSSLGKVSRIAQGVFQERCLMVA